MEKDYRYNRVKRELSKGRITMFQEFFDYIPKTLVGKDLGMHNQTFSKMLEHPELFTLSIIFQISALFEIEEGTLLNLIYRQYKANQFYKKR